MSSKYPGDVYPYVFGQNGMASMDNRLIASPMDLADARSVHFSHDRLDKEQAYESFGTAAGLAFGENITGFVQFPTNLQLTHAGTVSVSAGSTLVTGVGTAFLGLDHQSGDEITIATESRTIASIATNTSLNTTDAWSRSASGVAYNHRVSFRYFTVTTTGKIYRGNLTAQNVAQMDAVNVTGASNTVAWNGGIVRLISGGMEASGNVRKLFIFNGHSTVKQVDGVNNAADITTPPADWSGTNQPVNGVVHRNRLVGWGNYNQPHRLYFSQSSNHENFTGAGSLTVPLASNVGKRLYGGVVHNGILFVFKYPNGIFYLDDTDPDFANWSVRTTSEALGCAPSPHAALAIDDDVLFCTPEGHFHLLSAVANLGGVRSSDLTRALGLQGWTRDNIDATKLDQLVSLWDSHDKIAYFGLPNLLLKFDFGLVSRGGPVRFSYTTGVDPTALALINRDYGIGLRVPAIGNVHLVSAANPFQGGFGGINFRAMFPTNDFADKYPSLRYANKIYDGLEIVWKDAHFFGTLFVDVVVDSGSSQTLTFIPNPSDGTTPPQRYEYKKLNVGAGRTVKFTLRDDQTTARLDSLLGMNVFFRQADANSYARQT